MNGQVNLSPTIHIVKQGETIQSIANQYGVSVQRLIYDNEILNQAQLVTGQALIILIPETIHNVQSGETLTSIAQNYQTTVNQLLRNNPYLTLQENLIPGQTIVIKYKNGERINNLEVSGYAYPFIEKEMLQEIMPFLNELFVFSYGFTLEGELVPPLVEETFLLEQSAKYEVDPILVLTPLTPEGNFNNQLVKAVVTDIPMQDVLIQNLLEIMRAKNYKGLDVDFEFILPENRQDYVNFIKKITGVMNENGFRVSVALAPKTSDEQKGLLYEGMDYEGLGASANSVFLMTYEWGYTYGPPMAIAPINKVKEVVNYAITKIPKEKIVLGVPGYAYDWPLPYVRGTTKAETIGNTQAVQIAAQNGSTINFDQESQSPFFNYISNGITHEVWFEDVRSILEKVKLADQNDFKGIGYWNLMRPFRANWSLLNSIMTRVE